MYENRILNRNYNFLKILKLKPEKENTGEKPRRKK